LLNVFAAFRADRGDAPLYFASDIHWTPRGHQLMADELVPFVVRHLR